jgi:tRNA-2-methylthio-N6-dimethylallyladenosine synthase
MQKGKYYILTFGCQMNKSDSERIAGLLSEMGLEETKDIGKADVMFLNTCSVRQHAEDRVFGFLREWQKFRKNKPNLFIGVTGCMPGRDKDGKLQKKIPGVDWFFPIDDLVQLPKRLREFNPKLFKTDFADLENYWQFVPRREENFRAFVTIQTGCNNYCTYCVVPYARGPEKNRPLKEILVEIKNLVKGGCLEVTLLGQVVNNYKISDIKNLHKNNPFKNKDDFAALLWEINQIKGIKRINWTAADPQYFTDYQVNYLHLPVQSGDNDVLKKMNRKYTREYYLDLVKKIKKTKPSITLGTDVIVGFSGETKKQFQNTVDLFKQCDFDISYHAMYSERSGTLAAKKFKDNVSRLEKKKRWQVLQDIMEETVLRRNQKYLGQTVSVLVDRCVDEYCFGNSLEMKLVSFPGSDKLIGKIVKVKIVEVEKWVLYGKLIS